MPEPVFWGLIIALVLIGVITIITWLIEIIVALFLGWNE